LLGQRLVCPARISSAPDRAWSFSLGWRGLKLGWVEGDALAQKLFAVDALGQARGIERCHTGLREVQPARECRL
jgi:hypothetical protein